MRLLYTALLAVTAALLAAGAGAAPRVEVVAAQPGARLLVDGRLITHFRAANGSLSAARRAEVAADRLRELLADGLKAAEIGARPRADGGWGVFARGGLLMIATDAEADLRRESPEATARRWAVNLKETLAAAGPVARAPRAAPAPGVALAPAGGSQLVVPVGETRALALEGPGGPATAVRVEGAAASAEVAGAAVRVKGLAPGKATVRVTRGGRESAHIVWVKQYAGVVAEVPVGMVTGTVAPAAYVRKVAAERALDGVRREPGATVAITGPVEGVRALPRGENAVVRFPIAIRGAGLLENRTTAQVRVENLTLRPEPARVLLYSNDPESIREHGTLFEGVLDDDGPGRLMFHHQNRMGRPCTFEIHLLNPNTVPVDVQVIEADAGPVLDTIQVGHRAAQKYLEATLNDTGYVATVPPRKSRTIYGVTLPDRRTVSGIYNLRVLDGGPLIAHVSASPQPTSPEVTDDLLEAARSEPDTYPTPQKAETHRYRVGGSWTFIPLGRKPIAAKTPSRRLFGNYGVLYDLTVEIENPTQEEKTVTVRLAAEAGWTRGAFVIDGKVVEAPQIAPPAEATLWSARLAPQEVRQVRIQGIPVGGSSYPVSLVVRP